MQNDTYSISKNNYDLIKYLPALNITLSAEHIRHDYVGPPPGLPRSIPLRFPWRLWHLMSEHLPDAKIKRHLMIELVVKNFLSQYSLWPSRVKDKHEKFFSWSEQQEQNWPQFTGLCWGRWDHFLLRRTSSHLEKKQQKFVFDERRCHLLVYLYLFYTSNFPWDFKVLLTIDSAWKKNFWACLNCVKKLAFQHFSNKFHLHFKYIHVQHFM